MSVPRADTAEAHGRGYRPLAFGTSGMVKLKTVENKKTDTKKSNKTRRNKKQEQNLN